MPANHEAMTETLVNPEILEAVPTDLVSSRRSFFPSNFPSEDSTNFDPAKISEPDEILADLAKVDPETFGILYQRHVRPIYAYIYNRTGNVPEAEDLTAQTFYNALANMHRYKVGRAPFAAWLYRIAHNLTANWYRNNSRQQHRTEVLEGALDRDVEHDPTEGVIRDEAANELRRAISILPSDRKQLLALKFVSELPNATIAQYMGRTEGAIKALLHRTVVSLKNELISSRSPRPIQDLLQENRILDKTPGVCSTY